jgi:nucleoside-diphosphate-sugar epimerase
VEEAINSSDVILFLVGLVGDPITKKYPKLSSEINKDALSHLIKDTLDKVASKRLIFVSTCSNYGLLPEGQIANEETELAPLSLYARHKVEMEAEFFASGKHSNNCCTILRFATAFGLSPRMRFDLTVNQFTVEMASQADLLVFDPDTWRPYCHVNDFARLIDRVISVDTKLVDQQIFNAGSDENNFTKRQVVELISSKLENSNIKYKEHGSDPRNYRVSFEKLQEKLNFSTLYNVEFGVDEILKAYNERYFNDIQSQANQYGNYIIPG